MIASESRVRSVRLILAYFTSATCAARLLLLIAYLWSISFQVSFGFLPSKGEVLDSFRKRFSEAETVRAVYLEEFHWYPENVRRTLELHLVIKGEWLFREETYDAKTGILENIRRYNGGTEVMFVPDRSWAQIKPDKHSERYWHELEMGRCLWDMLKDATLNISPHPTDSSLAIVDANTPHARWNIVRRVVATISSAHDVQLHELQLFSPDGQLFRRIVYQDYTKVEADIWYPTDVTREEYAADKSGKPGVFDRTRWVLKQIEVNKPIRDEEIEIDLPDGTVILDNTMGKEFFYRKGEPLDERTAAIMELPGYRGGQLFLPLTSLGKTEKSEQQLQPLRQENQEQKTPVETKEVKATPRPDDAGRMRIVFVVLAGLTIILVAYRIIWRRRFQRLRHKE
jgi:hypothetical protein